MGDMNSDPVIGTAANLQIWLATTVSNTGPAIFLLALLAIGAAFT